MPFDWPHTIDFLLGYWSTIATVSLCCTVSEILSLSYLPNHGGPGGAKNVLI